MSWMLISLLLSAFMTGVIWIIQIVHYPSFRYIPDYQWSIAHKEHVSGITFIVAPVMVIEALSRLYLLYIQVNVTTIITSLFLLVIWLSTFFIQVPIHNQLEKSWSLQLVNRLVKTNWIRTALWTLNTAILFIGYTPNFS